MKKCEGSYEDLTAAAANTNHHGDLALSLSLGLGTAIKKGILLKRGRNRLYHPWYLRTILVTDRNKLLYYDEDKLKGVVSLQGCTVRALTLEETQGRAFGFEIANINQQRASQESRLVLVAGSLEEAQEWMQAVDKAKKLEHSSCSHQYESLGEMISKEKHSYAAMSDGSNKSRPVSMKKWMDECDEEDEDWDDVFFGENGKEA